MEVDSDSVKLSLDNELLKDALSQSIEAHKHNQPYLTNTNEHVAGSSSSNDVLIMAFKGSWEEKDWYHDDHFGETKVDPILFPALKRIGEDKPAKINGAIFGIFLDIFNNSGFKSEVEKAVVTDKKKILFAGHSYGGALACFATLWILDEYKRKQGHKFLVGCVTFGSPLIGDETLSHAVRREKWTGHFTHFVMQHDIFPRIMLAPKTSIKEHLTKILEFIKQKVNPTTHKPHKFAKYFNSKTALTIEPCLSVGANWMIGPTAERNIDDDQMVKREDAVVFFENVVINASTVASHDAYDLMEPTSFLKEKLSVDFVKVSPYRPFGRYVFCTCDETHGPDTPRQQLVVENPHAVLQLLFYFSQLPNENQDLAKFAVNSLAESLGYEEELNKNGLQLVNMVHLEDLNELLKSNGTTDDAIRTSNMALFELTASAKWCLMAVDEAEKRKKENMDLIKESMRKYQSEKTKPKQKIVEDILDIIRNYKVTHDNGNEDYYDTFKLQNNEDDFVANVNRLELAKIYDMIIEMVMRKDLPGEFEVWDELVKQGTLFRRLAEPLGIANYYRHLKGDGYMDVRPKRYKFTQRWYEHAHVMAFESISESNFIAEVEELKKEVERPKNKTREEAKAGVKNIKKQVEKWRSDDKIQNEDVFWGDSILSKLQEILA